MAMKNITSCAGDEGGDAHSAPSYAGSAAGGAAPSFSGSAAGCAAPPCSASAAAGAAERAAASLAAPLLYLSSCAHSSSGISRSMSVLSWTRYGHSKSRQSWPLCRAEPHLPSRCGGCGGAIEISESSCGCRPLCSLLRGGSGLSCIAAQGGATVILLWLSLCCVMRTCLSWRRNATLAWLVLLLQQSSPFSTS